MSSVDYLKSLPSIRSKCTKIFNLGLKNELKYWELDLSQESIIIDYVFELIQRDYGNQYDSIPSHGRWRHFIGNRIEPLLNQWKGIDSIEIARRLIDLMTISVLLDAGAGNLWKFKSKQGEFINRSEGLAVASLEMFEKGMFSSIPDQPFRVDSIGLAKITALEISNFMQVTEDNPMDGIGGRAQLLLKLSTVLTSLQSSQYFYQEATKTYRPGHLIDYLISHSTSIRIPSVSGSFKLAIQIETMWNIIVNGLSSVWPESRTKLNGISLGDVWPAEVLMRGGGEKDNFLEEGENLVPFHKLSQWLTYSLIEVMETILGWKFIGKEQMTGLPEYRNGGLLIDYNLLKPIYPTLLTSFSLPSTTPLPQGLLNLPPFHASHPAIVEMRAITVIMLDRIMKGLNEKISTTGEKLELVQVLEGGTWKAGREVAKKLRPTTAGPPFNIISDGTIF